MTRVETLIEEQQKGHENTDIWMVGEQLKELCQREPACAELVQQDLESGGMTLQKAAAKLKAKADEIHRKIKGNCVCIPPDMALQVLREAFGLPQGEAGAGTGTGRHPVGTPEIGLEDLL